MGDETRRHGDMGRHCVGDAMFRRSRLAHCWAVCTSSPLNAYSPCARTRLLSTARGDSSPQAHTACDQGVRTGTVGCTAIGATAPATHRRRLNGTRRSCVGHRREPLLSMADHGRACLATHADHRKGRTCRSKGGNPNPTSSKAIGSRDPADVPPRARRGSAVPTLTTAHGVHATTRGGDTRAVDLFCFLPFRFLPFRFVSPR